MEPLAIIGIYAGIMIAVLVYRIGKKIKNAKRLVWLHKIGLMETFDNTERY